MSTTFIQYFSGANSNEELENMRRKDWGSTEESNYFPVKKKITITVTDADQTDPEEENPEKDIDTRRKEWMVWKGLLPADYWRGDTITQTTKIDVCNSKSPYEKEQLIEYAAKVIKDIAVNDYTRGAIITIERY